MKKIFLGFVAIALSFQGLAQQELTLEQSISGIRSIFPESILDFQWMTDSKCYTQLSSDFGYLLKGTVKGDEMDTLLSTQEFNEVAGAQLFAIYGVEWKEASKFWISNRGNYYEFDISNKTAKTLVSLPEDAGDTKQSKSKGHVAYTVGNNVRIATVDGKEHVVTDIEDENIVSGQAIARSEFGITQGFFWSPNGARLAFYQKDESNVADYPLLDNSTTPGTLMNIKYPMAGQGSEKARVGIYDLSSKKLVYFEARGGEDNYLTNLSWTPDNKHVLIAEVNRDQDHMWLNVYDAATGKFVKTLLEEESDTWTEPEHPAFFPMENSNNFVWVSEKDGFNNLYYYNFEGELIQKLTDHDFIVQDIIDFVDGRLYYQTTGETPTEKIHRQLGTLEMEDQMAGVKYLKSLPYVDSDRLAVHGWSFGGFMTTSLMLRNAGTFNVGVAGGPVTDWKYYEIMYGERYMDRPDENHSRK